MNLPRSIIAANHLAHRCVPARHNYPGHCSRYRPRTPRISEAQRACRRRGAPKPTHRVSPRRFICASSRLADRRLRRAIDSPRRRHTPGFSHSGASAHSLLDSLGITPKQRRYATTHSDSWPSLFDALQLNRWNRRKSLHRHHGSCLRPATSRTVHQPGTLNHRLESGGFRPSAFDRPRRWPEPSVADS